MENKNSYFIAGFSFLLAVFATVAFVLFMNANKNDYADEYFVRANSLPTGIRKNTPVFFLGVPAGIVKDSYFIDQNQSTIEIRLAMLKGLQISRDSVAEVNTQILGGGATLNITRGSGQGFLPDEKKIIKIDDYLDTFGNKVYDIAGRLDESLKKLQSVIGDEKGGLVKMANTLSNDEILGDINQTLKNIKVFTKNLSEINLKGLEHEAITLSKEAKALSSDVRGAASSFGALSDEVLVRVKNGEFDFKAVLAEGKDEMVMLINSMRKTLRLVDGAFFRLEQNPYEFFFKDTKESK